MAPRRRVWCAPGQPYELGAATSPAAAWQSARRRVRSAHQPCGAVHGHLRSAPHPSAEPWGGDEVLLEVSQRPLQRPRSRGSTIIAGRVSVTLRAPMLTLHDLYTRFTRFFTSYLLAFYLLFTRFLLAFHSLFTVISLSFHSLFICISRTFHSLVHAPFKRPLRMLYTQLRANVTAR